MTNQSINYYFFFKRAFVDRKTILFDEIDTKNILFLGYFYFYYLASNRDHSILKYAYVRNTKHVNYEKKIYLNIRDKTIKKQIHYIYRLTVKLYWTVYGGACASQFFLWDYKYFSAEKHLCTFIIQRCTMDKPLPPCDVFLY